MNTEEFIRFLSDCKIHLMQIKDILIHENRPKNEWRLLCCFVVDAFKDLCWHNNLLLEARKAFLQKGFPAAADDGGIDFWMAIILIKNMKEHSDVNQIAETLKDYGFDFLSSCNALGRFFDITFCKPNVLMITKGEDRELENVINWPL
mgnify:CR=1 FL=1